MSKLETPMTERYWKTVGGTLIKEFRAVKAGPNQGQRLLDAVIIPDGETREAHWREVDVKGKDVIVVQTKAKRLGMYLMGQALFSRELLCDLGAKSVRTIALCAAPDAKMAELCARHGIEVVIDAAGAIGDVETEEETG